jgi:hypothetical protein
VKETEKSILLPAVSGVSKTLVRYKSIGKRASWQGATSDDQRTGAGLRRAVLRYNARRKEWRSM